MAAFEGEEGDEGDFDTGEGEAIEGADGHDICGVEEAEGSACGEDGGPVGGPADISQAHDNGGEESIV